jgi:CDP-glycerol glycerophosphotransferase
MREDSRNLKPVWISLNRKIIAEIRKDDSASAVYALSPRGVLTYLRATQIFVSHSFMDMCYFPPIRGKKVNYLWHGIPMRKIGLSSPDKRSKKFWKRWNSVVDRFFLSSHYEAKILHDAFGQEDIEIIECGNPRNDWLFGQSIEDRDTSKIGVRTILYAPTWRVTRNGGANNEVPLLHPEFDLSRIERFLRKIDAKLVIRPHVALKSPNHDSERIEYIPTEKVADLSRLFTYADVFVTDYSSAYFDWLITGKPVIFSAYDLEEYRKIYEFNDKYEEIVAGPIATNPIEIEDAIIRALGNPDEFGDIREEISCMVFGDNRGGACEKIMRIIESEAGL